MCFKLVIETSLLSSKSHWLNLGVRLLQFMFHCSTFTVGNLVLTIISLPAFGT